MPDLKEFLKNCKNTIVQHIPSNFTTILGYHFIFNMLVPIVLFQFINVLPTSLGLYLAFSLYMGHLWSRVYPEKLYGLYGVYSYNIQNPSKKDNLYALSHIFLLAVTIIGILLLTKIAYIPTHKLQLFHVLLAITYSIIYIGLASKGLDWVLTNSESYMKNYVPFTTPDNIYMFLVGISYALLLYLLQISVVEKL